MYPMHFKLTRAALCVAMALSATACSTPLVNSARAVVSGYCEVPTAVRMVNRAVVAEALRPNAIRVNCATDSLSGVLLGNELGKQVAPSVQEVEAAAPVVDMAAKAVTAYCGMAPAAREVARAEVAAAVTPNAVVIECADHAVSDAPPH